jgi:hypothetical protein
MSQTTVSQGTGPASYVQRAIDITITLGEGQFGATGSNTVKLSGLRVTAVIEKAPFPTYDVANIRVYGLTLSLMQTVSTLGVPRAMIRVRNSVLVEAGDSINGMSVVYAGYMVDAYQSFDESPETSLNIVGNAGRDQAIIPVPPLSFSSSFDVVTALSGLADRMGWGFENSGVSIQLPAGYYPGTALDQCYKIASDANINLYPDSSTNPITLAIWPKLGARNGAVPLISAATGLIGYPKYESNAMSFKCIYNPSLRAGGVINMQSTVGQAPTTIGAGQLVPEGTQSGGPNGQWTIVAPLVVDLAAQMPGGPWYNEVRCVRVNPGYAQTTPTTP